jgi:hypothetical protein
MTLTALTWIGWVLLVGAPLAGILAIVALAVFHEHRDPARTVADLAKGAPAPATGGQAFTPLAGRRASTLLFETYLEDDQLATAAERRKRLERSVTPAVRASTWVLEDHLAERAGTAQPITSAPTAPHA